MQRFGLIYSQNWYIGLPTWQKELVRTSLELFSREERMKSAFDDYSFIIFPMAKAYEGYLKDFFYQLNLIDYRTYTDKRFRIGRALNPDLNPHRQDEQWLYDDIVRFCGTEFGRGLWNTWLECRNQVFHYFPDNQKKISLSQAGQCLEMIALTMEKATMCKLEQVDEKK
jgi:hypothetical protein